MQVFVVTVGFPWSKDNAFVKGVFSTYEKAKECKDLIKNSFPSLGVWIHDFFLDE